ncbi:hypothetical protein [Crocosphaera subtropica]|nr:hypothetical protein [Crocosphaera subtropica]
MSIILIELLIVAVIAMALSSNPSQEKPDWAVIRVPINDEIRRS